jgi:hypothetical protein
MTLEMPEIDSKGKRLISLETLSSSDIGGVYLAIYKYIKMKKKLINPQTQKEYYPEHNV